MRARASRVVTALLIALVPAGTMILSSATAGGVVGGAPEPILTLVYAGADDCSPCRQWKRGAGADFRRSALFQMITYREVTSPGLVELLSDGRWPEDLRVYRDTLPRDTGAPLWLVLVDHRLVLRGFGTSQWEDIIQPALRSLTR